MSFRPVGLEDGKLKTFSQEESTSFQSFNEDSLQSTTSNSWVTRTNFPVTTTVLPVGKYKIDHSNQLGQSNKEKQVGLQVEYREGTTGPWTELVDVRDGLSVPDEFQLRTGFNIIEITSPTEIQIRVRFGQTNDGGTGRIKFTGVTVAKVIG